MAVPSIAARPARPQVPTPKATTPELIRARVREQSHLARLPYSVITWRLVRWLEVAP